MRAVLSLMLAASLACGGGAGGGDPYDNSPTGPGTTPNTPPPSTASVDMIKTSDGYGSDVHAFLPQRATVARGGTVRWSNSTGLSHNVTFARSDAPASIADFSSGSAARTFPNAGTYAYSCTNHSGMTGEVVVP